MTIFELQTVLTALVYSKPMAKSADAMDRHLDAIRAIVGEINSTIPKED